MAGACGCAADSCRRSRSRCEHAPDDRGVAERPHRARRADRRDGGAPRAARERELVVRLRQRARWSRFVLQIVTGICLATVYVPSADAAWESLVALNTTVPLGWFLRALHGWGSNFMVALVLIHMIQVVALRRLQVPARAHVDGRRRPAPAHARHGVHRTDHALRPGRVLGARHRRGDRRAHAARRPDGRASPPRRPDHRRVHAVALLRAARVRDSRPAAGARRAPPAAGAAPRHQRVADAGPPGDARDVPARVRGAGAARDGVPFFPTAAKRDLVFAGLIILGARRLRRASSVRSVPDGAARPDDHRHGAAPDFLFLWLYAALALLPPSIETPLLLVAPGRSASRVLLALPLLAGTGEKSWRRRPGRGDHGRPGAAGRSAR